MARIQNDSKIQEIQNQLSKILKANGRAFWDAVFGLANPHEGHCECGREPLKRDIGNDNFMCCDECKTFWYVGTYMTSYAQLVYDGCFDEKIGGEQNREAEVERSDRDNAALLQTYREIESCYPFVLYGVTGLLRSDEIVVHMQKHLNFLRKYRVIDDEVPF